MSDIKQDIDTNSWVDEFADPLYNYAVARVNDHDIALDLVQDTFYSAIKSLDNFQGKSSVKTWLYSILKRKIIDHWRKQDSRKTKPASSYFQEEGMSGHWADGFGPDDIENAELGQAILGCIDNLPEKWKGIVIDKLVQEEKTEVVCKDHDITTSNLWVIIHRAKVQLRDCLEKKWFDS